MSERCIRCGLSAHLARASAGNGATQVFWWCARCQRYAAGSAYFVSQSYLKSIGIDIAALPIVTRSSEPQPHCERCGSLGAEYHHWAPKHLFEDAELWPGSYLCVEGHHKWHAIVTPLMCQRESANA